LDGPFDSQTGLMNDGLRVAGLIPTAEPFTASGFVHAGGGGGETIAPALLQTAGTGAPVDWVLLELRSVVTPSVVLATRSAVVLRNGQIVNGSGGPVRLPALDGSYHVAVRHRNHLGAMTASPVSLGQSSTSVDFTLTASTTWGANARKTVGSVMTLWSGNAWRDAAVKYIGQDNDRDPILALIGGTVPTNVLAGYHLEDSNLDGLVKYVGQDNDRDPILSNIGGSIPTNTLPEQLP
jgi:hypothetical protein